MGQNTISDTLDDRQVTVNITKSDRISLQPGDFIGMYCIPDGFTGYSVDGFVILIFFF